MGEKSGKKRGDKRGERRDEKRGEKRGSIVTFPPVSFLYGTPSSFTISILILVTTMVVLLPQDTEAVSGDTKIGVNDIKWCEGINISVNGREGREE